MSLPEAFTTGSSIMPQKRNPDVFELMRGRSAVAQAALNEVLGDHAEIELRLPPRSAAHQTAAVPRHRLVPADARHPAGRPGGSALPTPTAFVWIRPFTRPRPRTRWSASENIPFREAYQRVAAALKEPK